MTNKTNKVHKVELTTQELRIIERAISFARHWGCFDKEETPSKSIALVVKMMTLRSGASTPEDDSASKDCEAVKPCGCCSCGYCSYCI